MKKCNTCGEIKPYDRFYRYVHSSDGYRGKCKDCMPKHKPTPEDKLRLKKYNCNCKKYEHIYKECDLSNLIHVEGSLYFDKESIKCFKKWKCGLKELKVHNMWDNLVVKCDRKRYWIKRLIATYVLNIPTDLHIVCINGKLDDLRPENLKGKFTRHKKNFTIDQALEKVTCETTKRYYETKSNKILNSEFEKEISRLTKNFGIEKVSEFAGETYLLINNYAERNLIFDIKKDIQCTFKALIKQKQRDKWKSKEVCFTENFHSRAEPSFYDY